MSRVLRLLIIAVVASAGLNGLSAQSSGTVVGQVIDQATRQALPGVQVYVAGLNRGTLTDQRGQYVLTNIAAGAHRVNAVLIGYGEASQTATVMAGATVRADFAMRPSAVELNAIVVNAVTGQAQRKRELGTNTASISAAEIARAPIKTMSDVLTARAPGVQLQGVAGTVGTSQRIRIRGANSISLTNDPLIFVDGVQTSNSRGGFGVGGQDYSRMNDLNPEDIANVEILKGPAASALYGTAAANGVILITTKRGHGGAAQWRATVETGNSEDKNPYQNNFLTYQTRNAALPLFTTRGNLNAAGYTYCPNESAARGICTQETTLSLNPFETPELTPYTKGSRSKYGLSVGGGSETVNYYVSGDAEADQGVIDFNEQDKINLRANLGARVSDDLGLTITAGYTRSTLHLSANDNNIFSPIINGVLATPFVFSDSMKALSNPGGRTGTGFGYFKSDIEEILTQQQVDRFIIGTSGNYRPLGWLNVNANVGLDYFGRDDQLTLQPNRLPIAATYTPGFRQAQRTSNYIWTANLAGVAEYKVLPSLSMTTTAGSSFTRELFESTFCYGVGIVEGTNSCSATSSLFAVDEGFNEVRTVGAYLQEQANWRDRVIVAASVRGDDNSAFGQDFGFIYYPGASISWVVSEENFFPKLPILSNLRLRTAYGKSGQRPNFRDAVTLFEPVSATSSNKELPAVRLNRIGNPDLKPERTREIEGGFDLGLLDNRVSLDFTYFTKESQDALIQRPLPPSYGLTGDGGSTGVIFDNLGSIRNWGTELSLNTRLVNTRVAALNMRLTASTLDNRIEDLGEDIQPIIFNRGNQQHKQGFPTGAFHARRYEVIQDSLVKRQQQASNGRVLLQRGDVRLVDEDRTTSANDTVHFMGYALPTNSQALSADLTLFGWVTISGLFERRAGNKQLNYTEYFRCVTGYARGIANAAGGQCAGVADPDATVEEQARFIAARFYNTQSGYIEDATFIKLRELSLTLSTPGSLAQRVPTLRGASLTFSGRNLKTWTDYTGLDPEINESGGGANFTQGEFNTQPPLRHYTARLNFVF